MRHDWINKVGMLSLVGFIVCAADTYAETNHYPVGARVLDATHKIVGPVVGIDSGARNPIVALNVAGSPIA